MSGPKAGAEIVALAYAAMAKADLETIFEAGDRVVQRGRTRSTVRATGAEFDIAEVHVWTVRNGALIAAEFYIDTPAMLDALG